MLNAQTTHPDKLSPFHRRDVPIKHHDLLSHFSVIQDYRQTGKIERKLTDILLLVICVVIAGAEGWKEIEDFGHDRLTWLQAYANFENGIPSHETLPA